MIRHRPGRAAAALVLVSLLAGCSSYQSFRRAELASAKGDWDEAVLRYMEAVEQEPDNLAFRAALLRAKVQASQEHFEKGKRYRDAGVEERALVELQQAVQLDPTNQYAQAELDELKRKILEAQLALGAPESLEELKKKTSGRRPQPPVLNPRSDEPIDLEFPEPTSVKDIYIALGKAFGINVLFDPNLKDQEINITLRQLTAQDALEVLMRAAGHFYKVQDEHTIIVVADTPQNRRNYEDLVIQTFFLSNADIKQVMTMLRSLVDAKKIATNEQLNAIILRDTADKVKVAERIIESNDKSKAEVVIDVELLQLNTGDMKNLGVQLSSYSLSQSYTDGTDTANPGIRFSDLDDLTANNWSLTIPSFIYNFAKSSTNAQILAKPQLRISEGEKATLLIGERVPVPTTTFNTSNTVGGNIVPLTTFQYTDVGIQIDLEPRVHHNKEVTLKVKVEVSNIANFVEGSGGQRQPVIGTRRIESTIRLKDGETNFLAGLIRTEEIETEVGVPGLSDIPLLGRLFGNNNRDRTRTDVILTMTPRIIRTPNVTEEDLLPIWVGTESNISFRGGSPRVESDVDGPFEQQDERERVQQMLRERLQRLPRGLREGANGEEEAEPEPPQGIELAPSSAPSSLFNDPVRGADPEDDVDDGENDTSSLQPVFELRLPGRVPQVAAPRLAPLEAAVSRLAAPSPAGKGEQGGKAPAVRLSLRPARQEVGPGAQFVVTVHADARERVSHLPLTLGFDARVVEVVAVEDGELLGGETEAALLADPSKPGRLVVGASRLGQQGGVAGEGVVARVTFRALAAGEAEITFTEAAARDAARAPLTVAAVPATVLVRDVPVPPPGEPRPDRPRLDTPE